MDTVYYTVQKGDTLYQLAKKYGTTVGMIARYNGIADPDRILEGQVLRIPVSEIPGLQEKMRRSPARATLDYIIRTGDTLSSLARAYGITPQKLASFNGMTDGNVLTVGEVLKIPLSTVPVRRPETVTVQPGDSLWKIAEMFGTNADTLAALNDISNPDLIKPGQVLRLPPAVNTENSANAANNQDGLTYTVQPGDSLWKIAEMSGTNTDTLAALNNISNPDLIQPGQVLRLPTADSSEKPANNNTEGRLEYTVQPGDSLWKIARKYGVSVAYLINLNRLTQPDLIIPGQVIVIRT